MYPCWKQLGHDLISPPDPFDSFLDFICVQLLHGFTKLLPRQSLPSPKIWGTSPQVRPAEELIKCVDGPSMQQGGPIITKFRWQDLDSSGHDKVHGALSGGLLGKGGTMADWSMPSRGYRANTINMLIVNIWCLTDWHAFIFWGLWQHGNSPLFTTPDMLNPCQFNPKCESFHFEGKKKNVHTHDHRSLFFFIPNQADSDRTKG